MPIDEDDVDDELAQAELDELSPLSIELSGGKSELERIEMLGM